MLDEQYPGAAIGEDVEHLPADVEKLYREVRQTASAGWYSAAVLLGRKLLMHVAVHKGAEGNQSFKQYVDWLTSERIVTDDMKDWVDEIRELGNEANHEVKLVERDQAEALVTFLGLLLKIVYEYPERGRRSVAARKAQVEGAGDRSPGDG